MACCKKSGCNVRREAIFDAAILTTAAEQSAAVIGKLLEIAAAGGGLMYIFKDNPKLTELAENIKLLAAENQYLKKKLSETETPAVVADAADLTFTFGPQQDYSLILPAGDPVLRGQLAKQLIKAAADLMGAQQQACSASPEQQMLPFIE